MHRYHSREGLLKNCTCFFKKEKTMLKAYFCWSFSSAPFPRLRPGFTSVNVDNLLINNDHYLFATLVSNKYLVEVFNETLYVFQFCASIKICLLLLWLNWIKLPPSMHLVVRFSLDQVMLLP